MLIRIFIGLFLLGFYSEQSEARVTFSPYYSVSSDKSIIAKKSKGTETEKKTFREEKGLKAGISFWKLFGASVSVGQNYKVTTSTESEISDEWGELDYSKDLNTSTSTPGSEKKIKETQNKAKVSVMFDPGFWILIARTKLGVTATQRLVDVYENDVLVSELKPEPTYKPHAGFGLGVKLSRRIKAMIEYDFFFYKFPETKVFERETSISFSFAI